MSVTITDLDPAAVTQAEEFLIAFLKEQYPSLDFTEGNVLRNLLIRPAAQFHVLEQTDIDQLRQSMSMLAIQENPALATDSVVDAVLSNYRITRDPGSKSQGQVTLVIQNLLTTPVPQNTIFTANGLTYRTTQAYVGVTTAAAVVSDQQRLIVRRNDSLYVFTVPVEATAVGQNYNAKKSTRFTMAPNVPGLIDAFATQDFLGGTDKETNSQLVDQFKLALSPQVFSGRIQISSLLQKTVPAMTALSIIGFGDPEMLRDRHNIFNVSYGGKADLYTRTQNVPIIKVLTKTATLVDLEEQIWQITVQRDDAPGFYTVESVLPVDSDPDEDTLEIISDTRGLDLSVRTDEFVPEVSNLIEGAYSRYQTAIVRFKDPDLSTEGMTVNSSTHDYDISLLYMPDIDTLQDLAVDRGSRNPQADYLVRAPIPAFATVSIQVQYIDNSDVPDADAIKLAVSNRVNSLGFALGMLPASVIYDAASDEISKTRAMISAPLDIIVRIRKPEGGVTMLRSANGIAVPDLPAEAVTSRTTVFYMDVNDVDVTLVKVAALPV